MSRMQFRSSVVYRKPKAVDREEGILHDVAVVTKGEARGHGVHLDDAFLDAVVSQGNEHSQGLKVRFGHPTMSGPAVGTYLGRLKEFYRDGNVVRANLYMSSMAEISPKGNLAEYVYSMAEREADMFGMSIVFAPGKNVEKDDRQFATLDTLHGADVVDDPAANDSMFDSGTLAQEVTQFIDAHPEVLDILANRPEIMNGFIARYEAYLERSKSMAEKVAENALPEVAENIADTSTENHTKTIAVDPKEFRRIAKEFGSDIASDVVFSGGGYADAMAMHYQVLKKENETLRERLSAAEEAAKVADAIPSEESEEKLNVNIPALVAQFRDAGMSAPEAWTKVRQEYSEAFQEYMEANTYKSR